MSCSLNQRCQRWHGLRALAECMRSDTPTVSTAPPSASELGPPQRTASAFGRQALSVSGGATSPSSAAPFPPQTMTTQQRTSRSAIPITRRLVGESRPLRFASPFPSPVSVGLSTIHPSIHPPTASFRASRPISSHLKPMARSTPALAMKAATVHDASAPARDSSTNAASAILQRHRGPRQRFDSADYVLGDSFQRALALTAQNASAAGCIDASPKDSSRSRARNDVELEPEPEVCHLGADKYHSFPRQSVRKLRLQRFDSADWAMQLDRAAHATSSAGAESAAAQHGNVAHLLLERHAYSTCTTIPIPTAGSSTSSRCAEQA